MKRVMLALAVSIVPAVVHAQQIPPSIPPPVPLPARDTLAVPQVVLLGWTPQSRSEEVLMGVVEGGAVGAAYGAALAQYRPDCAPSESPSASAAEGVIAGGVWGGLRALFGGRRLSRIRTVATNDRVPTQVSPRPSPDRGPLPPLADERCLATPAHTPESTH